jgi:hypothetical protein
MALTDLKVFNANLMEATIETLAQKVEMFNGASNGAITLTSVGFEGDYFERSFFGALHSAKRRVDRYGSNDAVSSTALAQLKDAAVKVAGGFGPIVFEPGQMLWIGSNESAAIEMISRNLAEVMVADQLNSAIAALVAAIGNQAGATNDVSGTAGISYAAMNEAHAKFGDASGSLVAQIMNGTSYHKLVGQNLTNVNTLFKSEGVLIVDILGKAVVVTDSDALYKTGTPNLLKVLSLSSGAATIFDGSDVVSNIETNNGKQRIETTMQADYTFGLGLKGYAWDTANGGKSPTDAEIATGTNWDKVVTSIKQTAGVITIGDASK